MGAKKERKMELNPEAMPRHIAIIMDGNGRWAKSEAFQGAWGTGKAQGTENNSGGMLQPWHQVSDGICLFMRELVQAAGRS